MMTVRPGFSWLMLVLLFFAPLALQAGSKVKVQESDEGFLFTEAGKSVLFYQRKPKSLEGRFERSNYVHPLYGLDGEILTEDFPADHFHHRGIFWAWHQLVIGGRPIGDGWAAENFSWEVQDAEILTLESGGKALKVDVIWKSPDWVDADGQEKPLVREITTIAVHAASADHRKIDFDIRLLSLEEGLLLGGSDDEKGYGGFACRIRILPGGMDMAGRRGAIEPDVNAIYPGPWVDLSGSFLEDGSKSGIAILTHPSLPVFPPPWILRKNHSMQNPVYPGRRPQPLSTSEPLVLRYRLIVHRGDAAQAGIDALQQAYEREP